MTHTRHAAAHLDLAVLEPSDILLSIAIADGPTRRNEQLTAHLNTTPVPLHEIPGEHGTRLHRIPTTTPGTLVVDYQVTVDGVAPATTPTDLEQIVYRRPSRYADSDTMFAIANSELAGLAGKPLLDAVTSWVGSHLAYVSGSSRPIDGAVDTYLARRGVCRDFAHLVIALLRARNLPARLASVYAPGLNPMDFHAVAEVYLDGQWNVVDATALAPRSSMLRIATGRDAADTAFLTVLDGNVAVNAMQVEATVSPTLPSDDVTQLVQLS